MKIIALTSIFIFICTVCYGGYFPDSSKPQQNLDSILNRVDKKFKSLRSDSTLNTLMAMSKEDTVLKRSLSEYQLFGLDHRKKTLQWNLTSSIIIFWSVIVLVFSGIVFAGLQFYISSKRKTNTVDSDFKTELEASMKGIKINSPVLGVIILMISLLFFYLYLVYVYPITEIF